MFMLFMKCKNTKIIENSRKNFFTAVLNLMVEGAEGNSVLIILC